MSAVTHSFPAAPSVPAGKSAGTSITPPVEVPVARPKLGMTAKQKMLLDFIKLYRAVHGITPSYEEMKDAVGLASKSGISRLVIALEERGHIRRIPGYARAIVPVEGA